MLEVCYVPLPPLFEVSLMLCHFPPRFQLFECDKTYLTLHCAGVHQLQISTMQNRFGTSMRVQKILSETCAPCSLCLHVLIKTHFADTTK